MEYSVIVLYWNKYDEIKLILSALAVQNYPKIDYEVIIVDDGSAVKLNDLVSRYSKQMNIQYLRRPHCGNRSNNRNYGAKHAKGKNLIFLDGDILPGKDLISNFEKHRKDGQVSVGYRVYLNKYEPNQISEYIVQNHFEIIENLPGTLDGRKTPMRYFRETNQYYRGGWQILYSACFSIAKWQFDQVNGFDEQFGENWGNEDIELGYRLWKNGADIKMIEDICVYHLYHHIELAKREEDFQKNSKFLVEKHRNWMVELFTKEAEIWSNEYIRIQERIISKEAIINEIKNIEEVKKKISANTILFGIENIELIKCEQVSFAYVPETRLMDNKVVNMIGFRTDFQDHVFSCGIVSQKYKNINEGLFMVLCEEASRICRSVWIMDEEGELQRYVRFNRAVLINLSPYYHMFKTQYCLLHFAIAAKKMGYLVGINVDIDLFQEIEFDNVFLLNEDENKQWLSEARNHTLNFAGNKIPCFMDSINACSERSLSSRILWQEQSLISQKEHDEIRSSYPTVFQKRKEDFASWNVKKEFLPVGIDTEQLYQYQCKNRDSNKVFILLWADQTINKNTNLIEIAEIVKNIKNIHLKIVTYNIEEYAKDNFIYNDSFNQWINSNIYNVVTKKRGYMEKLRGIMAETDNITLIEGVYKESDYIRQISECDAYINLNSLEEINPLVLYSVALGKKPIIWNRDTYIDYFSANEMISIDMVKKIEVLDDIFLESPEHEQKPLRLELAKPDIIKLSDTLRTLLSHRSAIEIGEDFRKKFCAEFDWKSIVSRFETIINNKEKGKRV